MIDPNEKELTPETENDVFRCTDCGKECTRKQIRKNWLGIPFGKEDKKKYYCGCHGWD